MGILDALFWKTVGRSKVQSLLKSVGYKRTAACLLILGVGVLKGLGHTALADQVSSIAGVVGMTPEAVQAPVSSAELVTYAMAAIGVLHPAFLFVKNLWAKRAAIAAVLKADAADKAAASVAPKA